MKKLLIFSFSLFLVGCSSLDTHTQYDDETHRYGLEIKSSPDDSSVYKSTFTANPKTPIEKILLYSRLGAVDKCLSEGLVPEITKTTNVSEIYNVKNTREFGLPTMEPTTSTTHSDMSLDDGFFSELTAKPVFFGFPSAETTFSCVTEQVAKINSKKKYSQIPDSLEVSFNSMKTKDLLNAFRRTKKTSSAPKMKTFGPNGVGSFNAGKVSLESEQNFIEKGLRTRNYICGELSAISKLNEPVPSACKKSYSLERL